MPLLQTDETSAGITIGVPGLAGDTVSWVSNDTAIAGGAASADVTLVNESSSPVQVQGGASGNVPGLVRVGTGAAVGTGGSGDILFRTGNASAGPSGDVIIALGLSQAGTRRGQVLREDTLAVATYSGPLLHEPLQEPPAGLPLLQGATVGIGEFEFPAPSILTIPADTFWSGGALRFKVLVTARDAAGASALTVRVRLNFGGTANIVAETAAVDPATDDIFMIDGVAIIPQFGAAGTVRSSGFTMEGTPDTTSTMEPYLLSGVSSVSTAADITVSVTVQFTANDTDARLDLFQVSVATGG